MDHVKTILIWIKDSAIYALVFCGMVAIASIFYANEIISALPSSVPQSDWNYLGVRLIVAIFVIGGVTKCIEVLGSFIANKSN